MNKYITLDGKKYATMRDWTPQAQKPMTTRVLANGALDVTYGQGTLNQYSGEIIARIDETRPDYGTSSDLETSLRKLEGLNFIDHDGVAHTVHIGGFKRRSLKVDWGAAGNKFYYQTVLIYA